MIVDPYVEDWKVNIFLRGAYRQGVKGTWSGCSLNPSYRLNYHAISNFEFICGTIQIKEKRSVDYEANTSHKSEYDDLTFRAWRETQRISYPYQHSES